jgi:hypothetical protein
LLLFLWLVLLLSQLSLMWSPLPLLLLQWMIAAVAAAVAAASVLQ